MTESDEEIIGAFHRIPGAWLMELKDGWYAYRDDETRLGPFKSKVEAARAGLQCWLKW